MFRYLVQRRLPLSLRVSNSANGATKSASKKSAKFDDDAVAEVRLFSKSTMPDAAEEASAAVESPKKKRKDVSDESEQQRKQAERQRSRPRRMPRRQRRQPRRPERKQRGRLRRK